MQNIFMILIIIFVLFISYRIYTESDYIHLKCIVSDKDSNTYCVRDRKNMDESADLLAEVTMRLKKLVAYVGKTYPNRENVKRLVKNFNPKRVVETLPNSTYTAYSENKGEKIAFCLEEKKGENKLIDLNTLTFVAIHEIAHTMTKSIGHKPEFWENFKFLLENAVKIKVYTPIDYNKQHVSYCGMDITDNPLYDM